MNIFRLSKILCLLLIIIIMFLGFGNVSSLKQKLAKRNSRKKLFLRTSGLNGICYVKTINPSLKYQVRVNSVFVLHLVRYLISVNNQLSGAFFNTPKFENILLIFDNSIFTDNFSTFWVFMHHCLNI